MGARLGTIVATCTWARGLDAVRTGDDLWQAWTASTRLGRIAVREPDDGTRFSSSGDPGEDALDAARLAAAPAIERARGARDVSAAMAASRPLSVAVARFFDDVLVNSDDAAIRARRYALVRETAATFARIAEFGKITDQGGER